MNGDEIFDESQLPLDFDPDGYLELNSDVREAGVDPKRHYLESGRNEGRLFSPIAGVPSELDFALHSNPDTKRPKFARHETIWDWIREENARRPGLRVLEIGSRSVVGEPQWKKFIPDCDYTGFDIREGQNVDIEGDIHRLSDYFSAESFDLVLSFAVFEHLAMPWVAAEEIAQVLASDGHVVIETHFSFSEHELPWHYFQFNSNALEVMFCPELGFELVDSGLDTPIVGRFSKAAGESLSGQFVRDLYCHSSLIARKSLNSTKGLADGVFDWKGLAEKLTSESTYPLASDFLRRQRLNRKPT